jgi:hypothetical protein
MHGRCRKGVIGGREAKELFMSLRGMLCYPIHSHLSFTPSFVFVEAKYNIKSQKEVQQQQAMKAKPSGGVLA